MTTFRDLLLRHAGQTIAVLGGAPSLPEEAARLPGDVVRISANEHGCILGRCDYIVALDRTRGDGTPAEPFLRKFGVPIIAPHTWADYRMTDHPQMTYTGMLGAWVAWAMGASLIALAGMGCYLDAQTYFHGHDTIGRTRPFEGQRKGWERVKACVSAPIRAMGGPLVETFGAYDPRESLPPYSPLERHVLLAQCAGLTVEILKDHGRGRGNHSFRRGQVLELPHNEAQRLLALRVARLHVEAAG